MPPDPETGGYTPNAPEPARDSRVVRVNLDAEILKLAQKDGITDVAILTQMVSLSRRDNYANTVTSYYHGYDAGFAAGLSNAAGPVIFWVRLKHVLRGFYRSPTFMFIMGGIVVYLCCRYYLR